MKKTIITRFAPSPTGFLHVGGARTALFNYLFARKNEGVFRLRIEDTDRNRSSEEMTQKIFDGLKWLGMDWDGEVVFQGANVERHREMASLLLEKGWAYRCFCTPEDLAEKRKKADPKKAGSYFYDKTCRNLSPAEIRGHLEQNKPFAIRFKTPEGQTSWEDAVHGEIKINNREIDDFIILRSDRSPVYQLAVVVDDHDMGITHVIRGDDHLSNTPKQILLYLAFGWNIPLFVHLPLILGPDKKRLSKRHGATSVEEYRKAGVLPEAMFNYLVFLGWSPGENREIMSREEIINRFSLDGISKNSPIFDEKKLFWMNGPYLSHKDAAELLPEIVRIWEENGFLDKKRSAEEKEWLLAVIDLLKTRAHNFADFADMGSYFFLDPESYQAKGVKKYFDNSKVWKWLEKTALKLSELTEFNETTIEETVRGIAAEYEIAAAKLIHPLRLALTGRTASPGLFEVMKLLGKETVLRRLQKIFKQKEVLENLKQAEQE